MTSAEAAFTTSATEAPEIFTLLLLGSGLVGLGGYGREHGIIKSIIQFVKKYGTGG